MRKKKRRARDIVPPGEENIMNASSGMDNDTLRGMQKGQHFHVEDNGQVILVKKPRMDRFPKPFIQGMKAELG